MRALIYCRVSTQEQAGEHHYSLDNQLRQCYDYTDARQWCVVQVVQEVGSGTNGRRKGYTSLITAIDAGAVDVVVVYRLDRLSRNVHNIYQFLQILERCDGAFVSVLEAFDTTTAIGAAMLGMAAVFAQLTSEIIGENARAGLASRAKAGLYNGPKLTLFGYDYNPATTQMVRNESEAKTVLQIYEWYIKRKWSLAKIAQMLDKQQTSKRTPGNWSPAHVHRLLTNRFYAGDVRYGAGFVPGTHIPIVSHSLFEAAYKRYEKRRDRSAHLMPTKHLLAGVVRCAGCGRYLTVFERGRHRSSNDAAKRPYFAYHHGAQKATSTPCPGTVRSGNKLDDAVVACLIDCARGTIVLVPVKDGITDEKHQWERYRAAEQAAITGELEELEAKAAAWRHRMTEGIIDESQFQAHKKRLQLLEADLRLRSVTLCQEAKREMPAEPSEEDVLTALNALAEAFCTAGDSSFTLAQRKRLLSMVLTDVFVHDYDMELRIRHHKPVFAPAYFRRGSGTMRRPLVP